MPIYTFENICLEDKQTLLNDGTKKVIINANAFTKAENKNLSGFLEYVKTGKVTTEFTGRIENMIEKLKSNEQARSEYRFISGFEMDARYYGRKEGWQEGLEEGRQEGLKEGRQAGMQAGREQGFTEGVMQTAKKLLDIGLSVENISKATGLSCNEIEKLKIKQ